MSLINRDGRVLRMEYKGYPNTHTRAVTKGNIYNKT